MKIMRDTIGGGGSVGAPTASPEALSLSIDTTRLDPDVLRQSIESVQFGPGDLRQWNFPGRVLGINEPESPDLSLLETQPGRVSQPELVPRISRWRKSMAGVIAMGSIFATACGTAEEQDAKPPQPLPAAAADELEEASTSAKSTQGAVRLAIPEIKDPITVGSGNIRQPTEDERKDLDKKTGTVETDVGGCSAYLFFDVSGQTLLGGEANQHCEPVIGDLIYDGPQRRTGNSYDITDLYSEAVRIGTVVREDGKVLNVYAPDSVIFSVVEGLDAATVAQMINEVRASEETLQALKPDDTLWVTGTAGRPGQETSYAIPVIEYNTKPYSWLDNVGQLSAAGNVAGGGLKCLIAADDGMSGAAVHIPPVNYGEKPTYAGVLYDVSASDEKLHSPWPIYEYPGGVQTLTGYTTRAESMADRLEQVHETAVRFGESTVGAGVCLVAVAR